VLIPSSPFLKSFILSLKFPFSISLMASTCFDNSLVHTPHKGLYNSMIFNKP
jgi:hypothetical protein